MLSNADESDTASVASTGEFSKDQMLNLGLDVLRNNKMADTGGFVREKLRITMAVPAEVPGARVRLLCVAAEHVPRAICRRAAIVTKVPDCDSPLADTYACELFVYGTIEEVNSARAAVVREVDNFFPEGFVVHRDEFSNDLVPLQTDKIVGGYHLDGNKGVCQESDYTDPDMAAALKQSPIRRITLTEDVTKSARFNML